MAVKLLPLPGELAGAGRGKWSTGLAVKLIHLPASWQGFIPSKLNGYRFQMSFHGPNWLSSSVKCIRVSVTIVPHTLNRTLNRIPYSDTLNRSLLTRSLSAVNDVLALKSVNDVVAAISIRLSEGTKCNRLRVRRRVAEERLVAA